MAGLKDRLRIFKKYSTNLQESLALHGMCPVRKVDYGIEKIEESIYVCPLCSRYYLEESVYQVGNRQPLLTLEHNPPDNVGGSASVLSCAICNNSNGSKLDKVVSTYLKTEDFIKGKEGAKIEARFTMSNIRFWGELELNKTKANIIYLNRLSNEFGFSKLVGGTHNFNQIDFQFKLADWEILYKSLLKIAHLTAFKYLGYTYILNYSGFNTIQVLNDNLKHPHSNYGVVGLDFEDEHVGLHVINEPKELRSLLVVQKVRTKEKEKNIGIVIPAPDEAGWNVLTNLNHYKSKQVKFSLTKHMFDKFPCGVETYYQLFRE